ncbi:hypothetical protein PL9631_1100041 [Planktothrix paucivesiculata PCC 9631]|uniref:Uncharacterized protein n=1 Tax=Planktothrix paucivesiculata PCC 9631 TaxID=671071 RepID=A0A7Z9BIR8_9CYAN|nr:hypothetical protein PL9631_1100041 [Planktothrix paucivesiculata PCC 9631]
MLYLAPYFCLSPINWNCVIVCSESFRTQKALKGLLRFKVQEIWD